MGTIAADREYVAPPRHAWLRKLHLAKVVDWQTPLLEKVIAGVLGGFQQHGHEIQSTPDEETDLLITTAPFNEPINWRKSLIFTARRRFGLKHLPTVFTFVHATRQRFAELLDHISEALRRAPPRPQDFIFPGLSKRAHNVLVEQGRRGGPIMALERLVQAQAKSIRTILVVGDDDPQEAYHFDLAGSHPCTTAESLESFYDDIVLRITTTASTSEVANHAVEGVPIKRSVWEKLTTPKAMQRAGREFGARGFFSQMVRVADMVNVPAVSEVVASQYSEGCFATWDPELSALIATVTGSARAVEKHDIGDDDLAVIVGVKPDGSGAIARHVRGKGNDPPSSEALELMDMDQPLPKIRLSEGWGFDARVPVVRSKLHGHRGVAAYDPGTVENVLLDEAYHHYPVSCATGAQAQAIKAAFSRSQALQKPDDPRRIVFCVIPCHGIVIAEKWVSGKEAFQVIWEALDSGALQLENKVPQGPHSYAPAADGRMILHTA